MPEAGEIISLRSHSVLKANIDLCYFSEHWNQWDTGIFSELSYKVQDLSILVFSSLSMIYVSAHMNMLLTINCITILDQPTAVFRMF